MALKDKYYIDIKVILLNLCGSDCWAVNKRKKRKSGDKNAKIDLTREDRIRVN